jgi:TatA/E family protein of Tat protein translocase
MIMGHWWVIVGLLLIVLVFYGPGRMSEIGGALGKGLTEFRKASSRVLDGEKPADNHAKAELPPSGSKPAADGPKP